MKGKYEKQEKYGTTKQWYKYKMIIKIYVETTEMFEPAKFSTV